MFDGIVEVLKAELDGSVFGDDRCFEKNVGEIFRGVGSDQLSVHCFGEFLHGFWENIPNCPSSE